MVLMAVGRFMKRNVTNILILSMSTSDLMSILIACPFQVSLELLNFGMSFILEAV